MYIRYKCAIQYENVIVTAQTMRYCLTSRLAVADFICEQALDVFRKAAPEEERRKWETQAGSVLHWPAQYTQLRTYTACQ